MRKYWRHPGYWGWWWRNRISGEAKATAAVLFAVALGVVGFLTAARLAPTQSAATFTTQRVVTLRDTSGAPRVVTQSETVTRPGTVRRDGSTVTVRAPGETATVRASGEERVVTDRRTNTVVQTETASRLTTVTTPGRTDTVTTQVTQPVTETTTERVTVTDETTVTQTVTDEVTVTVTVTLP